MKKEKMFLILVLAGVVSTFGLPAKKAFAQTFPLPAPNSGSGASANNIYFVTADGPAGAATCADRIISGVGTARGCHYDASALPPASSIRPNCDFGDHKTGFVIPSVLHPAVIPGQNDTNPNIAYSAVIGLVSGSPDLVCTGGRSGSFPSGYASTPCTLRVVRACLRTSSLLNATEP